MQPNSMILMCLIQWGKSRKGRKWPIDHFKLSPFVNPVTKMNPNCNRIPIQHYLSFKCTFCHPKPPNVGPEHMCVVFFPLLGVEGQLLSMRFSNLFTVTAIIIKNVQ